MFHASSGPSTVGSVPPYSGHRWIHHARLQSSPCSLLPEPSKPCWSRTTRSMLSFHASSILSPLDLPLLTLVATRSTTPASSCRLVPSHRIHHPCRSHVGLHCCLSRTRWALVLPALALVIIAPVPQVRAATRSSVVIELWGPHSHALIAKDEELQLEVRSPGDMDVVPIFMSW
jgi:hypothetical protein